MSAIRPQMFVMMRDRAEAAEAALDAAESDRDRKDDLGRAMTAGLGRAAQERDVAEAALADLRARITAAGRDHRLTTAPRWPAEHTGVLCSCGATMPTTMFVGHVLRALLDDTHHTGDAP